MGDPHAVPLTDACRGDVAAIETHIPGIHRSQAGDRLDQFGLAIALNPATPTISPARTVMLIA